MRYIPFITFLTVIYLLLTANLEWLNILVGFIIAVGITLLIRPSIQVFSMRALPSAVLALVQRCCDTRRQDEGGALGRQVAAL